MIVFNKILILRLIFHRMCKTEDTDKQKNIQDFGTGILRDQFYHNKSTPKSACFLVFKHNISKIIMFDINE